MITNTATIRICTGVFFTVIGFGVSTYAETAQDKFHKAFYLERALGDCTAAGKLYTEVVNEAGSDAKLKSLAQERQAICREEVAGKDFLSLMPPDALVYVELKRPGEQVLRLLDQLGLTARKDKANPSNVPQIAISPALIRGVLGAGGAAAAITGFNPLKQQPTGVLVFHAGDLEVVRGFIETALPAAALPAEPIGGHPTYKIEDKAIVTLTARLAVVSTERGPIEGVIQRLKGTESKSLAGNPRLAEAVKVRGDSLLFFAVDAKTVMPYVQGIAAAAGGGGQPLALFQAVFDPNSLQSIVGRVGMGDDGAFLNLEARLDQGHHNLVYNFARTAPINRDTLKCIPEGAAGFFAFAFSDASSRFTATPSSKTDAPPIVTFMDIGREIFANITSVAVYALPPEGKREDGAPPIPDLAAVISVNDPSKSEALWRQLLGIASMAAGAPTMDGGITRIEGAEVRSYTFPNKVSVRFATLENDLILSSTASAMARSIRAKRSGPSILKDAAFTQSLARLGPDSTKALFVHPGRCAAIAKQFMSAEDAKEMEPFLPLLSNTVAAVVVEHSGELLRFSGGVSGIPDISGLVSQKLQEEMGGRHSERRTERPNPVRKSQAGSRDEEDDDDDDEGNEEEDEVDEVDDSRAAARTLKAHELSAIVGKFKELASEKGDPAKIEALSEQILKKLPEDAKLLNNLAWALLTEEQYHGKLNAVALRLSERSNDLADYGEWTFLDTLAYAKFKAGQFEEAVKLQKKAIKHANGRADDELKGRLAEFEAALARSKRAP